MERYIQGTILILALTVMGCLGTDNPYLLILIAGVLLCTQCQQSLSEDGHLGIFLMQMVLATIFMVISGDYQAALLFYMIGNGSAMQGRKYMRYFKFALPVMGYFGVQISSALMGKELMVPLMIFRTLLLILIMVVMHLVQWLLENYITVRSQVSKAVSITAVNEMYAKKLNQELVIKNYLADKSARLEERENISRNIHNSVGHSITAAIMTLEAADMLFETSPDAAREKMNTANERIRTSLASIRQAVRVLDSENKYVSMEDFICELKAVIDSFVIDTMIKVHTDFEAVKREQMIPHEHTEFLTGAVQELLSNGVRHGKADMFMVMLQADSGNMKIKVRDNGKSDFSAENAGERIAHGFGLKKLTSYVKKCGGTAVFTNDNGFQAELTIRLLKEEAEHE